MVLDLRGPILTDHERRARGVDYVERVLSAGAGLRGRSVIAAYEWLPFIEVMLGGRRQNAVEYVHVPDRASLERYRAAGAVLYDLPGAEDESRLVNGVSLRDYGSRPLAVAIAR